MSDDLPALRLVIVMAIGLCGLFVRDCVTHAHAQDRDDPVARCLVAERGSHIEDDGALLTVLRRRSVRFHGSLAATAQRYCAALHSAHPSLRQAEIRLLPGGSAARRYANAWASALASIAAFRAGTLRHTCNAEPDEWGDRLSDARRARRAGWVLLDCGRTANLLWKHGAVRATVARGRR